MRKLENSIMTGTGVKARDFKDLDLGSVSWKGICNAAIHMRIS